MSLVPARDPPDAAARLIVEMAVLAQPPGLQLQMAQLLLANVAAALSFLSDRENAAQELYKAADRIATLRED